MSKIIETKITRFDGGIVNDPRDPAENTCRVVTGFDILTNPHKMTPYRQSESGDDGAATSKKRNFCVALRTGTTYSLYALGVKSGVTNAEVLYKNLTTGVDNDLDDNVWVPNGAVAKYQSSNTFTWFELFVYYKKTGLIYGARGSSVAVGTNLWAYDPSGSANFDENVIVTDGGSAFTFSTIAQGLVHSKDDILYIPYDNKIAKNNNKTWDTAALTLPTHLYITGICEYGNYLAIACAPLSGVGKSYVFLWDMTSTTWNEMIEWGEGTLQIIEDIDGLLIGISFSRNLSITTTNYLRFSERAVFRYLSVSNAIKFGEILFDRVHPSVQACRTGIYPIKQKADNRLYFMMSGVLNGRVCEGVWSLGRSSPSSLMVLVHERTPNNDTVITWDTSEGLKSFYIIGDYVFISYEDEGTYALSKTDADELYATSIYETKRFDGGDASKKKDLVGVTVMTEYLPAAGQVVLKYRTDATTTWSDAVFTEATNNSISCSAVNSLPKDYKEIEFRIESTGGAEVIGLKFKEEIIGKDIYD